MVSHDRTFVFSSSLPSQHGEQAERILFYNLQQEKMKDGIRAVSKTYGLPRLVEEDERLRLIVRSDVEVQTLFVTVHGEGPVGAIVFTREDDALVALYMAVREDYSAKGRHASDKLMIKMLKELEGIAGRVRGVSALYLYLGGETPVKKTLRR